MATYTWPDGSKNHTIPWAAHQAHMASMVTGPDGKQHAPGDIIPGIAVKGKPVTYQQWASGAFAEALAPGSTQPGGSADPASSTAPDGTQAPAPSAQPPDPGLELAALAGGRNIAISNADTAYQTGNLSFDYGYNPDGTINTANPYSRATLLEDAYHNSQRAALNSFAANGQLTSSAYGHQQGINDNNYAQRASANRLAYQRAMQGLNTSRLQTYANNAIGVSNNDFTGLLKATYPGSG